MNILQCICIPHVKFDDIDKDKDGYITLNEFNDYMIEKTGKPPTLEQWIRFHMSDIRHDGKISRSEFSNMIII